MTRKLTVNTGYKKKMMILPRAFGRSAHRECRKSIDYMILHYMIYSWHLRKFAHVYVYKVGNFLRDRKCE